MRLADSFGIAWQKISTPLPALSNLGNAAGVVQAIAIIWAFLEAVSRAIGYLFTINFSFTGAVLNGVKDVAQVRPEVSAPARPGTPLDPMDPNTGNFGIPMRGRGETLAAIALRANAQSILTQTPDVKGLSDFLGRFGDVNFLGDHCRIDPYAGILVRRILPIPDGVLLLSQGSRQSVIGRAQIYEPGLEGINLEAPHRTVFKRLVKSGSVTTLSNDAGDRLVLRVSQDRMSTEMSGMDDVSQTWSNCACKFKGSFINCDDKLMSLKD